MSEAFDNEPQAVALARLQLLKLELEAARGLTARVRDSLEDSRGHSARLRGEVAAARAHAEEILAVAHARAAQIAAQATQIDEQARRLEAQAAQLQAQTAHSQAQAAHIEAQAAHIQTQASHIQAQAAALRALEARADQLQAQAADMAQSLREQADALSNIIAERDRELALRQEVLHGAYAHIEALHNSMSWRVTRPLRALSRALRSTAARGRNLARAALTRLRRQPAVAAVLSPQGRVFEQRNYEAVQGSGLFDADWYRATYPDVANSGIDPLLHYLRGGWREGRRPGPKFDLDFYRYRYPDIAELGLDPLLHYAVYGEREEREMRAVGQWKKPEAGFAAGETAPILPAPDLDPALWPKVAVAVHAFYPDVFDAYCDRLADMPGRFTLLVSTPSEAVKTQVEQSIAAHGLNADADVRVTQNRGRNFGPLLAEFAPVVLKHDLLLHLHTKKSLHNASGEQTAWRDDILRGLVGKGVLERVIGLFGTRHDLGLVYTRAFKPMSYFANHWLQNSHHARPLFARLGVGDYTDRGYINYPVGGMFWARVQAIRPLLQAGFTYEDFPPEAGQMDGTIAHAIERCFVDLARAGGFTYAEVDPSENLVRLGWSDKNLDRYEMNTLDSMKTAIDRYDIVSFDIFDTLLTRPSLSADAVQRFAGVRLAAEHPKAPDFFKARKAAEAAARAERNNLGDVGLDEIYQRMADAGGWTPKALKRARALELQVELDILLTRPAVIEGLRYAKAAGKRLFAVSDTYFGRSEIEALLSAAGLDPEDFEQIFLSSEQDARKDSGALWAKLKTMALGDSSRWLHLGDNEVSDMQRAGDTGIALFHAMNPVVLLQQKGVLSRATLDAIEHGGGWTGALLLGPAAARLAADPYPAGGALGPSRVETAHDLGYCAYGPALFAFCAWLATDPRATSRDALYFLAREGWALQPIYDRIRAALATGAAPPSRYLYASRRAVLMAAQHGRFDPSAVIDGPVFHGDLAGLLHARLGFDIPAGAGVDGGRAIGLPQDAALVRAALEALRGPIEAQAAQEAAALAAYLDQQGLGRDSGIVDVGYRATIQKGLQAPLGHGLAGFYMGTFPEAASAGAAHGYFGEGLDHAGHDRLVRCAILLEAFLTAPEGQLDHFALDAGGVATPVLRPSTRTDDDRSALAALHGGALAYAEDLLRWYGPAIVSLDFDREMALDLLRAFAEGRLRAPPEVLRALRVDDAFCGYEEHEVGLDLAGDQP